MKYTLKTIRETQVYKANIDAIKAIYPNDWKNFAEELQIAANALGYNFNAYHPRLSGFGHWNLTPQDWIPWGALYLEITRYNEIMEHL